MLLITCGRVRGGGCSAASELPPNPNSSARLSNNRRSSFRDMIQSASHSSMSRQGTDGGRWRGTRSPEDRINSSFMLRRPSADSHPAIDSNVEDANVSAGDKPDHNLLQSSMAASSASSSAVSHSSLAVLNDFSEASSASSSSSIAKRDRPNCGEVAPDNASRSRTRFPSSSSTTALPLRSDTDL